MLQFLKSRLPSFKDSAFGWDGLTTFIFSNVLLLLTLGMFFLWLLFRTLQVAMSTKTSVPEAQTGESAGWMVLIAGLCLDHNQLTDEFKTRLDRAISLGQEGSDPAKTIDRIIILGGLTGDNQISEARAGADYLLAQGMAASRIMLEDQSRHTLENMQHARSLLFEIQEAGSNLTAPQRSKLPENMVIISSRYHLFRAQTLARGLNMDLQPVAAEPSLEFSMQLLLRLLKETYYLHWYWSGKLWVYVTGNRKSQARIS